MRISVTVFVILISTYIVNASILDPVIENVVHLQASKPPSGVPGIWKKKTIWKPRWVKEWKSAKVVKPVWRKVWSPVQIKEWVPIPKPPPGWDSISTPLVKVESHKETKKSPRQTTPKGNSLLWDPVPYPQSQQPPPPSHAFHHADNYCVNGRCGEPLAFNHQQISEIINSHKNFDSYKAPDYSQAAEFSESVTHLRRLPPNAHNWRPPQQNFQFDNRFFPELPQFLIPPKFQPLPNNDVQFQFGNQNQNQQQKFQNYQNINSRPNDIVQVSHSPGFQLNQGQNNGLRQWTPLPPQNNIKGHFITKAPDQPYKFQIPEPETHNKHNSENQNKIKEVAPGGEPNLNAGFNTQSVNNNNLPLQVDNDFIQQAQLVGEYHYSEFDLTKDANSQPVNPESNTAQKVENLTPQQNTKAHQAPQHNAPNGAQGAKNNVRPEVESKPRQIRTNNQQPQQSFTYHNKPQVPQTQTNPPRSNTNIQPQQSHIHHSKPHAQVNPSKPASNFQQPQQSHTHHNKPHGPNTQVNHSKPTSNFQQPQQSHTQHSKPQVPQTQYNPPKPTSNFQQPQQSHSHHNKPHVPQIQTNPPRSTSNAQQPQSHSHHNKPQVPQQPSSPKPTSNNQQPQPSFTHYSATNAINPLKSTLSFEQQKAITKEIYPFYIPKPSLNATSFPPNHRFAPEENNRLEGSTQEQSLNKTLAQPNPKSETNLLLQSLFSQESSTTQKVTSSQVVNKINYNITESTHGTSVQSTTPFTVFPASSSPSSTESVTKSPVFIVTPSYTIKT